MSEQHYLVQGALCQCQFSEKPETDTLQVNTQTKNYINDAGIYKLAASTKDIGKTFEKNTFGNCTLQPNGSGYNPCQIHVTQWSGFYELKTLENQGKTLLENSKAGCAIGGPDCITIKDHGQIAAVTQQNLDNANDAVLAQIYPFGDLKDFDNPVQEAE